MNTPVDVTQLAVRREDAPGHATAPRRHPVTRYVLPACVMAGFLALFGWAARDRLLPSREVTVIPVIARQATAQQAGEVLFTAAGWVEPRPTPVLVTALAEGVVQRLLVVDDQAVEAGQPVAQLIDADARLALRQAEADLNVKEAELEIAQATLSAARVRLDQPLHLESALAEADSLLAQAQTELGNLPFEIRAAQSRQRLAQQELERKRSAGQAVPARDIDRAKTEWEAAGAQLEQLQARQPRLENQRAALKRRRSALKKQLEQKTAETRDLAEAAAKVKAAQAQLQQARLAVEAAQLRLDRMTVVAPVAGRVLELAAKPGTRVAGTSSRTAQESGTVVVLYDPRLLQVRADVRLEDLPRVVPGRPVRIQTAALSQPLEGQVLFPTSVADIQKNTLQVKVAVKDPPAVLKPEMLVQVRFLALAAIRIGPSDGPLCCFVPRQLVNRGDDGDYVWVADQTAGMARRQIVKTAGHDQGELVEVVEGLTLASRLIVAGRDGLRDGQRITVTGEDEILGLGAPSDKVQGVPPKLFREEGPPRGSR